MRSDWPSPCVVASRSRPGAATRTAATVLVLLAGVPADGVAAQDWPPWNGALGDLPPNEAFIGDPEGGPPDLDGTGGFVAPHGGPDRGNDGRAEGPPAVTRVRIGGDRAHGAYGRGERIVVRVSFDQPLVVRAAPRLALTIGGETRLADLGSFIHNFSLLDFTYEVQAADFDADGVSVAADALRLNGGTIRNAVGVDANLDLGDRAVENDPYFRIDGGVDNPPTYQWGQHKAPDHGDTYGRGERIDFWLNFSERVIVSGAPRLALTIGSRTRLASFHRVGASDLTSGSSLRFFYDVQASDRDPDGIGIAADALRLNGGTIRDSSGANVNLNLGDAASGHNAVDGRIDRPPAVRFVSHWCTADRITVPVQLNRLVAVTGVPRLVLAIGSQTRLATLDGVSWNHVWGFTTLAFAYAVQASDRDPDGIGVPADALRLNGGTIRDASGADANLDLGGRAFTDGCTVGDEPGAAPAVRRIWLSRPQNGETYLRGEAIEGTVEFDQPVTVTGTPQLMLSFGSQVRPADFSHLPEPGAASPRFAYTVDAADQAPAGVSIAANALRLNGGSIRSVAGGVPALLDHSPLPAVAFRKAAGDRVDALPPVVRSAGVLSWPRTAGGYRGGETIRLEVSFNEYVDVDALELTIGGATRVARAVDHGDGSRFGRWFEYVVEASDVDFDGISVAPDALKSGGGAFTDTHGNPAPLGLGHRAIDDHFAHRVNAPVLSRVPAPGGSMTTFQVTDLRRLIDAARARCGIPSVSWSDPTIVPGVTPVRAAHVTQARAALAAAYQACGRTSPLWTDPSLAPGTSIKALHFTELRNAAAALR